MEKTLRIAVTGPESSGKSSLAMELSKKLNLPLVLEYARIYLEERGPNYKVANVFEMANGQWESWLPFENKSFVADTEFLVYSIWLQERFYTQSEIIEDYIQQQQFDLYLLCKPDIPWEEDPIRENPLDRTYLFKKYETQLTNRKLNFITVNGNLEQRVHQTLSYLEKHFKISFPM